MFNQPLTITTEQKGLLAWNLSYRRLMQNPITQKKLSSVRALNIPVAELRDDPDATCIYLKKVCAEAVAEDGIDTVVLGCLGLAQYGEEVEKECGVKVIDPAFVALGCAELAARLTLKPSRRSVAAYRRNQK